VRRGLSAGLAGPLRGAHRLAARHPARVELLERLDGAEEPPWAALRDALLAL